MDILQKTYDQMPYIFTSNEFSSKAKKNGITQEEVNNGLISSYLHRYAKQHGSRRKWIKIIHNNISFQKSEKDENQLIEEAIKLLKQHGYKIMKPINDWIEL